MFEIKVLAANVLLPAGMMLVAIVVHWWLIRRDAANDQQVEQESGASDHEAGQKTRLPQFAEALTGMLSGLAILGAYALRIDWTLWPQDSWARIPSAACIVALAAVIASFMPAVIGWPLRFGGLAFAAYSVFPRGEAWEDLASQETLWVGAVALGTGPAWLAITYLPPRIAGTLSAAWILLAVAAAFLTAQSFMRVTEPMMAVASIFGMVAIGTWIVGSPVLIQGGIGPALFAMSAGSSNAQLNSYLGITNYLPTLAILAPACAAIVAALLPMAEQRWGRRMAVAIACCVILSVVIIVWTQTVAGGGEEEW